MDNPSELPERDTPSPVIPPTLRIDVPAPGRGGAAVEELDDELLAEIVALFNEADESLDLEAPLAAARSYAQAIELLPEPRAQWPFALQLYAALGDALLELGQIEQALEALHAALLTPGATDNPYVWLRLGDAYRLSGLEQEAIDAYTSAYEIAGKEIFEEEAEALAMLERSLP